MAAPVAAPVTPPVAAPVVATVTQPEQQQLQQPDKISQNESSETPDQSIAMQEGESESLRTDSTDKVSLNYFLSNSYFSVSI